MLRRLMTVLLVLNVALASVAQASVGIANGTISGDLDLGEILKNAAISVGTQYLTNAVNLRAGGETEAADAMQEAGQAANEAAEAFGNRTFNLLDGTWGKGLTNPLLGFGEDLTVANILEGGFDATLSAGVQTAAHGGDFGDAFKGSFINSVVALGLADAQTGIGTIFQGGANGGEGSLGHVMLHGFAGCVAAEAQGADCRAGAAGGIAQAVYAGGLEGNTLTDEQQRTRAELIGAAAGWLFSGGEAENVSTAASVALSGFQNNYLSHNQVLRLEAELGQCAARADCDLDDKMRILARYGEYSEANRAEMLACNNAAWWEHHR